MSEQKARPYQDEAISEIRSLFAKGIKRVLLHLATGAGKTFCFSYIAKAAAKKGSHVLVVVRGIKLVQQAADRLTREGVVHGVIQGQNTYNLNMPVIVASIDTLYARRHIPEADLVIIDEVHLSFGSGYEWFLDQYKDRFILGVSATPHDKKRGMRHVADEVVYPISIGELMKQGYLCPMEYYAPSAIDRDELKKSSTGDYTEKSMTDVMTKSVIMGDIVSNWQKNGQNRPTFLFCSSIKHSKEMVARFRESGVLIDHIDANTPKSERMAILNKLESGEIQIVSNVNVLTVGVDVPPLSCLIIARPTLSYNLHIQMLGRGTRIFPGKENCIVFDHVGNLATHGFIEDEKRCQLDPVPLKERRKEKLPRVVTCESCFAAYPWKGNGRICPLCGHENKNDQTKKQEDLDFELKKIERDEEWKSDVKHYIEIARQMKYRRGWVFHKISALHGKEVAEKAWPMIRSARGLPKAATMNTKN